jgi:hypothetical protein
MHSNTYVMPELARQRSAEVVRDVRLRHSQKSRRLTRKRVISRIW